MNKRYDSPRTRRLLGDSQNMEKTLIVDVNGNLVEIQIRIQRVYAFKDVRKKLPSVV